MEAAPTNGRRMTARTLLPLLVSATVSALSPQQAALHSRSLRPFLMGPSPQLISRRCCGAHMASVGGVGDGTTAGDMNPRNDRPARPPYLLTNLPHPTYRGQLMGWLHKTRTWYYLAGTYLFAAAVLSTRSATPLSLTQYAWRVLAAAATSANVLISDGYHNGDQRGKTAYTPEVETHWLRCDYVGISSVLSTQYWLWGSNLGWVRQLGPMGYVSAISTLVIALLARFVVPKKAGHSMVKGIMGFQFAALFGYLIALCVCSAPCRINALIYAAYAPGLVMYAIKKPKRPDFGFHEAFHTSVLIGHSASMLLDLRDILKPCVRGVAAICNLGLAAC